MSVKVKYGDSDSIDQLPSSNEAMLPADYSRIVPLLAEDSEKFVKGDTSLKYYLYLLAILIALSYSDPLILRAKPELKTMFNGHLIVVLKAAVFIVLLYIIDNFNILKLK